MVQIFMNLRQHPLSPGKMAIKRSAEESGLIQPRPRQQARKRRRISSSVPEAVNSSDPSSCSVSEDSALRSSPSISERTRQSSISSIQPSTSQDESESSVSDSSDETSDSDNDEEVVTIGGSKKPDMSHLCITEGAQDLRSRLSSFLPQLAEANESLTTGERALNLEDLEEGDQHIEMNLGLGVLEEQKGSENSSETSDDEEVSENDEDESASPRAGESAPKSRESKVMDKLRGQDKRPKKVGIKDLG